MCFVLGGDDCFNPKMKTLLKRFRPFGILSLTIATFFLSSVSLGFLVHPNHQKTRGLHVAIEGLVEDFDSLSALDDTLKSLKEQLPSTLIQPLTTVSAGKVYDNDFRLTVLVPNSNDDEDDSQEEDDPNGEIELLRSLDELVSLSDVVVLATSVAQQARNILTGRNTNSQGTPKINQIVHCQLVLDDDLDCIRVPWKTRVPILGSLGSDTDNSRNDLLEGVSEFHLNSDGKIKAHRIRQVTFNGRNLNGPEIGQALRATQAAATNIQKSPFFPQNVFTNGPGRNLFDELRGGILEQAATAASARASSSKVASPPSVFQVSSIKAINTWINTSDFNVSYATKTPLPGTDAWKNYASSHLCLTRFCEQAIPMLAGNDPTKSYVDRNLFASNVTFTSLDGESLMHGNEMISDFYQSLLLARRGTGQTWKLKRASVLDWESRSLSIEYEATNSLPRWKIQGCDVYTLSKSDQPIVEQIKQVEFKASSPDSNIYIDSQWLMKNLVGTAKRSRGVTNIGEVFSDLLLQPGGLPTMGTANLSTTGRKKLSESAAANVYYIMSELHSSAASLLNDTDGGAMLLPPAGEYMMDQIELRGYLGETLIRGKTLYNRGFSAILFGAKQSIAQKRLILEEVVTPRVELTPKGAIRFSLKLNFRIPPPGAGFGVSQPSIGVPLKIELVSDYIIDEASGLISRHTFVETRVNGQLTPGDVFSKWIQRLLRMEGEKTQGSPTPNEDFFKSFTDAIALFRTFQGGSEN